MLNTMGITMQYIMKKTTPNRSMFSQWMASQHATEIHMQFGFGSFSLAHLFIVLLFSLFCLIFHFGFYNLFIFLLDWRTTFKSVSEQKNQVNGNDRSGQCAIGYEEKEDKIATTKTATAAAKKEWCDRLIIDPDVKRFKITLNNV